MNAADVNEEPLEGFFIPVKNRPSIQPNILCPRLTRARHRSLNLNAVAAYEDPIQIEDITAVHCRGSNFDHTIDDIVTPLQRPIADPPTRVPVVERWYTKSPPWSEAGDDVPHRQATPGSFSEAKKGCLVLTSQEHIGDQSMDNARSYALMYGTIRYEYVDYGTDTPMFFVDYGQPWLHYHVAQSLCDLRPLEAQGSVVVSGGNVPNAVPWQGSKELDFGEAVQGEGNAGDGDTSGAAGSETMLLSADTLVRRESRGLVHQFPLPLPARGEWPLVERRIEGYSEEYLATGTNDSTAHKPFPKVTNINLPAHDLLLGLEQDAYTYSWTPDCQVQFEALVRVTGVPYNSPPAEEESHITHCNEDCCPEGIHVDLAEMQADIFVEDPIWSYPTWGI